MTIDSTKEELIKFRMPVIWWIGAGISIALATIGVVIAYYELVS